MDLMNYELLPAVVVSTKDDEHLGRIKVSIPGAESPAVTQLEALPWCYPLTMTGTYQGFTKLVDGCKVWVIRNRKDNLEMWWIPMHELNPNTQEIVDGYDNVDVLISRDLGGNNVYIYYTDGKGIVISLGKSKVCLTPKGSIEIQDAGGAIIRLEDEFIKLNTSTTDDPVPKGTELCKVIDDIVNCFDTLMNACTGNWTTSHIPPQLQSAIKTLKDDHKNGDPWLSKTVVLS